MKVTPEKKHLLDCDRCGSKIHDVLSVLTLERPISREKDRTFCDTYRFKLCPRCARALFAWIGNAKEVKP